MNKSMSIWTALLFVSLLVAPSALLANVRTLEEIVVTAQKREQSQQDVPISIQVLDGDALSANNIDSVYDLQKISASVSVAEGFNPNTIATLIRGFGTLLASENGEIQQSVVVSVDDVPYSRAGGFFLDLIDIERVEVLRGPQGTLFGKNATAGVLNITTAAPSLETGGKLEVVATSDDEATVRGTVTGALGSVASRLTFWNSNRDGHIQNFGPAEDPGGRDSWGLRSKFEFELSDNATALVTARYSESENSSQFVLAEAFDIPIPGLMQADSLLPVIAGPENDQVNINSDSYSETDDWSLGLTLNWSISDSLNLTSISQYREIDSILRTDVDQTPLPFVPSSTNTFLLVFDDLNQPVESESFSQEVRLSGSGSQIDWTAGAYYSSYDEFAEDFAPFLVGSPGVPNSGFLLDQGLFNDYQNDSYALFGEVEWGLNDRLSLITGLRWTREEIDWTSTRVSNIAPTTVLGNDFSDDAVTGRVSLRWAASDTTNLYTTISQGYKAPGLSLVNRVTTVDEVEVENEDALSFEAGVKSELADGRVRLNANLFYTTVEDLQAFRLIAGTTDTELLNIGEADSYGLEVELDWLVSDNFLLSLSAVYNDSEYTDFIYDCFIGQTAGQGCTIDLSGDGIADSQDLEGQPLSNLPEFKAVVTGRYDFNFGGPFDVYLAGKYRWQDDVNYLITANPVAVQDSHGVLDLTLGFEDPDGRWNAQLYAQNVTDEFHAVRRSFAAAVGGAFHILGRDYETYYGIKLRYNFGGI